jgi:hypothetical protein
MFIMTHNEIEHVLQQKKKTLTEIQLSIIGHKRKIQTDIQIVVGGNLIGYESSSSICPADLDMVKLHWNSIISLLGAQCMCLEIKNFYL